ncbi:MAG: membrane protein insertase YidC [Chitinivibrionales bacterium]|nr:membrane protein insertase YidC [Chitinivibrionales bacterium]
MKLLVSGMFLLLDSLIRLTHDIPLALILLSLCVRLLMLPLFAIAHVWQRRVNEQKSLLQPLIAQIKKNYRGEEQTKRILAVHKENGISPLYALKSLFGTALQVPLFIAAYDMLSENTALRGVEFLWIKDLSLPDHFARLPFAVPFFGPYFNLLPCCMTALTLVTAWLYKEQSLSHVLWKKQRNNLIGLAGIFFVLLYTSPAGMVIYWTVNNCLSLGTVFKNHFAAKDRTGPI